MDRLLKLDETSAMTTLPVNTLRYMRHHGTGPKSFKLGRRVMYKQSDVIAWIEQQYTAAGSEPHNGKPAA